MGVSVDWDNEQQTILRYDFDERWGWEDFYAAKTIGDTMIDQTQHTDYIGCLFVVPYATMPQNVLSNTRSGMNTKHARVLQIVIVSDNRFVSMLYEMLVKLYRPLKREMLRANTLDDARDMLVKALADTPKK